MKRKVKVRKAQFGGNAQMQQQSVQQEVTDQDIAQTAIAMMQNGLDSDAIMQRLIDSGIDQARVNNILSSIEESIQDEKALQEPESIEDNISADEMQVEQDMLAQQAAEEEEYKRRLAELYYTSEPDEEGYEEEQVLQNNILSKNGGALPSKRTFVKNTVNALKAQNGTEMQNSKADSTDTGERQKQQDEFITNVQGAANEALMKKDADLIYENLSSYMPAAQFGMNMGSRQGRRFNRKLNRMIEQIPLPINQTGFASPFSVMTAPMLGGFNQVGYQVPAFGSYYGGPKLANIDVRRTGLFGRPKEYTVTFAQEAYTNPTLRENIVKQETINRTQSEKEISEKQGAKKGEEDRDSKFITFQPQSKVTESATVKKAKVVPTSTVNTATQSARPVSYVNPMDQTVKTTWTAPGNIVVPNPTLNQEPWKPALQTRWGNVLQNFNVKQLGGFVDPNSSLSKFIYGGDDSFMSLPETAGKLTNSPYFEEGGLYKAQKGYWQNGQWIEGIHPKDAEELKRNNTLPATDVTWEEWDKMTPEQRIVAMNTTESNTVKGYSDYGYNSYSPYVFPGGYAKQKGLPYDPVTGETYYGSFSPGTTLNRIDVKKTRLSGMPKKYTMYFTDYFPEDTETSFAESVKPAKQERETGFGFKRLVDRPIRTIGAGITNTIDKTKNIFNRQLPTEQNGGLLEAQTGVGLDPRFYPEMPSEEDLNMFIQGAPSLETKATQSDEGIAFNDLLGMKKYVKGQVEKQGIDPTTFGDEQEMKKILANPKERAVDMKNKMSGQQRRYYLDMINAFGNRAIDLLGEVGQKDRMRKMNERYLADNLYGSTGEYDRGTYEANSGLFRPDEMGFTGVVKYGGNINYKEGGEHWMSEEDIKKFLEEGGELEFV